MSDIFEYYYRYHATIHFSVRAILYLDKYLVLKHTPCGVWIEDYPGHKKFVRKDAKKQWACDTIEKALESFYARKRRQIQILKDKLQKAELELNAKPESNSFTL